MKKLMSIVLLILAIATVTFSRPALAGGSGAEIFAAKCAVCHGGGKNTINPAKTLQKSDLEKYGMNSLDAVIAQITKGKPPMPGFKGLLTEADIKNVANYVLAQSEAGW